MEHVRKLADHYGESEEKYYKATLFRSDALLLGINCLKPGQIQQPHHHAEQDKFYYVVEGTGRFWLGQSRIDAREGEVVWAPASLEHGVENDGESQLILLVGIAPAP